MELEQATDPPGSVGQVADQGEGQLLQHALPSLCYNRRV